MKCLQFINNWRIVDMHCNYSEKCPRKNVIRYALCLFTYTLHMWWQYIPGSISAHRKWWNRMRGTQTKKQVFGYIVLIWKFENPTCLVQITFYFFEHFYGFLWLVVWPNSGHFWWVYQSHYCASESVFLFFFVYVVYQILLLIFMENK